MRDDGHRANARRDEALEALWEVREEHARDSTGKVGVMVSLAGLGSQRAWEMTGCALCAL